MRWKTNFTNRDQLRGIRVAIGLLLMMILCHPETLAQQASSSQNVGDLSMADLLKLPGKVLGEGKNTQPVGPLKLLKYRLEELQLPHAVSVELNGQQVNVDKAWRVKITGGPFPVRALPAVIWIDDQIVGIGMENELLSEITAITFDRSLLRQGGTLSISYGEDKDSRVSLPEKLNLKTR
jgi:hypothetical protein